MTDQDLIDHGLIMEDPRSGRWKYKFAYGNPSWFTANTKSDAIERATAAFNAHPPELRITRAQQNISADQERYNRMAALYGGWEQSELDAEVGRLESEITGLQRAGRREFNSGARRTSAAVSNEAARNVGQHRLDMIYYIQRNAK